MALSVAFVLLLAQVSLAPCDAVRSAALTEEARRDASLRNFDAASAKLRNAFEACPQNRGLLVEKANALLMGGRFADAIAASDSILLTDSRNTAALKIRGNAAYFQGNTPLAVNTFITLLERNPTDEDGAYMLGRIYYQEGKIDEATGQFQRLLKLNPASYRAWDNLGLCWQARGDSKKAIAHFLQAIKLVETDHPDYDWAYANLADLLVQNGDAEQAFASAAKAAKRNPNSARNFYIGAKALDKLGKTELCLNWLQRAVALDPNYSEPQYLLVRVYHRLGQHDKAEEARKKFLATRAKEPDKRR